MTKSFSVSQYSFFPHFFQELCDNPHFVVAGFNSGDVHQGALGNCWFVAATGNLAQEKELWERVGASIKHTLFTLSEQLQECHL